MNGAQPERFLFQSESGRLVAYVRAEAFDAALTWAEALEAALVLDQARLAALAIAARAVVSVALAPDWCPMCAWDGDHDAACPLAALAALLPAEEGRA